MAQAGDLHWERQEAGLYRTIFWANDYLYRIEKDFAYANTWRAYYRWRNDSRKNWILLSRGYGSSHETLKKAKQVCLHHNLRPRRKFKFIGRVDDKFLADKGDYVKKMIRRDHWGYLVYQELNRNGEPMSAYKYYLNPKEVGGVDANIELQRMREEEQRRHLQNFQNVKLLRSS